MFQEHNTSSEEKLLKKFYVVYCDSGDEVAVMTCALLEDAEFAVELINAAGHEGHYLEFSV